MNKPTPRQIDRAAHDNPYLTTCLRFWHDGELTYEQAMMLAVLSLAEQVQDLQARLCVKFEQASPEVLR